MREQKEVICKDGIYYCPVCGSKKNNNKHKCGIK